MDKLLVAIVAEESGSALIAPRTSWEESVPLRSAAIPRTAKETFGNHVVCSGMGPTFGCRLSIATATVKATVADGAVLRRRDGAAFYLLGHYSLFQGHELLFRALYKLTSIPVQERHPEPTSL